MDVDVSLDGRVVEIKNELCVGVEPEHQVVWASSRDGTLRAGQRVTCGIGSWMTWVKGVRNC